MLMTNLRASSSISLKINVACHFDTISDWDLTMVLLDASTVSATRSACLFVKMDMMMWVA